MSFDMSIMVKLAIVLAAIFLALWCGGDGAFLLVLADSLVGGE